MAIGYPPLVPSAALLRFARKMVCVKFCKIGCGIDAEEVVEVEFDGRLQCLGRMVMSRRVS
jgi:hypothetical protein